MSKQKEIEKGNDAPQEQRITDADYMRSFKVWMGKIHEGISQINDEAQDIMLRKFAEGAVEGMLLSMERMTGRDPRAFDVDEMIKTHEPIENQFANDKATITREGNIITWKSNVAHCYDPKIEHGMIKPYPAYCKWCGNYFFEGLYGVAHKGPVKVENLKSVLKGDDECLTRIELL